MTPTVILFCSCVAAAMSACLQTGEPHPGAAAGDGQIFPVPPPPAGISLPGPPPTPPLAPEGGPALPADAGLPDTGGIPGAAGLGADGTGSVRRADGGGLVETMPVPN
ncbi:MAG: hypothetical protein KF819_02965 [Labilithrix sp.]|nr:hypothetical protein [Labilithrix sp.]